MSTVYDAAQPDRTSDATLARLLGWVHAQEPIRVALLNGSRANPALQPDLLSDWDILLGVRDLGQFGTPEWLAHFGRVRLLQRPDAGAGRIAWLVVFGDGTRIDFTFVPLEGIETESRADSLTRVLVDKDSLLPGLPPADESSHWISRPAAKEFAACANEFWWVSAYVAKGLWRGHLLYARHTFESVVRVELERMLTWYVAAAREWRFNPGAYNKSLQAALAEDLWQTYSATLPGASPQEHWNALLSACNLMENVGSRLASGLGFTWNAGEATAARELIETIRATPPGATSLNLR